MNLLTVYMLIISSQMGLRNLRPGYVDRTFFKTYRMEELSAGGNGIFVYSTRRMDPRPST
jgi:hypothetical protein